MAEVVAVVDHEEGVLLLGGVTEQLLELLLVRDEVVLVHYKVELLIGAREEDTPCCVRSTGW